MVGEGVKVEIGTSKCMAVIEEVIVEMVVMIETVEIQINFLQIK